MLLEEDLTSEIIAAAIDVHRALGPGLLESVYEECLCRELQLRGIVFERQVDLPIVYKGIRLREGFRIDIFVERRIVLELKAVDRVLPIHEAQLLTYLRLSKSRVGLLLNFNVVAMRHGVVRRVL